MTNEQKINLIAQKILLLSKQVDQHRHELDQLARELEALKGSSVTTTAPPITHVQQPVTPPVLEEKIPVEEIEDVVKEPVISVSEPQKQVSQPVPLYQQPVKEKKTTTLEEKIGSKLFSIIGIIVLVLGVSIGVKYAIDKDMINETGRLVLGFAAGLILMGFAFFFKKKYTVFSAVLLSGAMAIMYFTTYLGYSSYHKYPAGVAFAVMALFTVFTVLAANIYNFEVIALIGLVGGYALPPLLSTGGGQIEYMFGFMLLLNLGVLALSFLKYWKFVNHVAYALTWLIFVSWMTVSYDPHVYFGRTMLFATAFFLVFYLSFIAYKLFRNKPFSAWDVILVMSNSMIYFGVGYNALSRGEHNTYERFEGLFCVLNAAIHLSFAFLCRKKELADKTIFHFILAMVISFLTIAVPVQLDGNYVTLIWFMELMVLLWMWRRFESLLYFILASAVGVLAFGSLMNDWTMYFDGYDLLLPLGTNRYFITGLFGIAAYWGAWLLLRNSKEQKPAYAGFVSGIRYMVLVMALFVTYFTFENEISLYFQQQYKASVAMIKDGYGGSYETYDHTWKSFKAIWILNYTAVFLVVLGLTAMKRFKDSIGTYISWGLTLVFIFGSMLVGLITLSSLRPESHLLNGDTQFVITSWNTGIRYVYLLFMALPVAMIYLYRNSDLMKPLRPVNTALFHVILLIFLSSELTNQMIASHPLDYLHFRKVSFRMGYTVLWGVYSMLLIVYGIIRQHKMLRILAMVLFGVTIIKLAIDALSMTQGYRLIVFITIGVILLLVSFMYQKFKNVLFGNDSEENHETKPE
ncbi:MAG: DUF2339 domain-containing protein [Bacteroidetes bacterium]|nr:DUF2339 domain-containing protein [Bacteroidota bacterium]